MLRLKSLKEPTNPEDGLRILIARYRPRYLPKNKESWDLWWKDLAPSKALFKEFVKDKTIGWNEYESSDVSHCSGILMTRSFCCISRKLIS
jgi:uncharacterized protein YeaO (DUF488 family)